MIAPQAVPKQLPLQAGSLTGLSLGQGRFQIRSHLGAGGMGEVYLAFDSRLKRRVAIKRIAPHLRSDPDMRRRFVREAERACRLNDPHIATLYDLHEEGEQVFLIMEFVEGTT